MEEKKSQRILVSVTPSDVTELDNWRRDQKDLPSRSKAVRELFKAGLEATKDKD